VADAAVDRGAIMHLAGIGHDYITRERRDLSDQELAMRDTMTEIVDDLADHADATPKPKEGEPATPTLPVLSREDLHPAWQVDFPVLCIASRSPLDEAAAMMLAQLLKNHGVSARVSAIRARGLGESAQGRCTGCTLGLSLVLRGRRQPGPRTLSHPG
jgi:hypothetical protein